MLSPYEQSILNDSTITYLPSGPNLDWTEEEYVLATKVVAFEEVWNILASVSKDQRKLLLKQLIAGV